MMKPKPNKPRGRFVALLRGVNVGKAKRVAMAELRALCEQQLGWSQVQTLLNSGNVVFDNSSGHSPAELASALQAALAEQLALSSQVSVISAEALDAMIAANPLLDGMDSPSRMMVAVLRTPEAATSRSALAELLAQDWSPDRLAAGPGCAYIDCANGILASPLVAQFERRLRDQATSRNWATMLKLQALARPDSRH
jgi:uncharacterized protein (DUF1697 family)